MPDLPPPHDSPHVPHAHAVPAAKARGRGAQINPTNRFESLSLHVLPDYLDEVIEEAPDGRQFRTLVYADKTKTIINRVDSPDLGFKWTINPYRGCEHGCIYCYARPGHEYLGFSCGLDFETKIVAKLDAPQLLRKELSRKSWKREPIVMSGVTDPYQPVERKLRVTRGCLEVMAAFRQPVSFITKNELILRDLDLLATLNEHAQVRCAVSLTTLDPVLAAKMEPRASSPAGRLRAIEKLSEAGLRVAVMTAPIVPGLNDREIPALLRAAKDAGASSAGYVLLKLPHQIKDVFLNWLAREFPDRASHVESLVRQSRGGALYEAKVGVRQRGRGAVADQIGQLFRRFAREAGFDVSKRPRKTARSDNEREREERNGQLGLFG